MSQYSSLSDSASETSSSSSLSVLISSSEEDEQYSDLRYDPDFIGIVPYPSRKENTFIYDIKIDVSITSSRNQACFKKDYVRTVLLVILGRLLHEHEEWKQIFAYLMKILEERMDADGSWTTERRNHHVYQGKVGLSGHCNHLKDLPGDLPVVYEELEADFPLGKSGKSKSNQRVVYRATAFLSPALDSAGGFYNDHGFAKDVPDWGCLGMEETQRCFKLYLKNIAKHQRRREVTTYDDQLAWGTVFEAMREVREDPNYECSGDESPDGFYNRRYRRNRY